MKPDRDALKIVIVCALKEEFAAIEKGLGIAYRERFELIRAGMGHASADRVARELAARATPPEWVVSTGFGGGLADGLTVGDLGVCGEIVSSESGAICGGEKSAAGARSLCAELSRHGIPFKPMRAVCARQAVFSGFDKRALGERFDAQVVDMESGALASGVDSSKTNVINLRAISDTVSDHLPPEIEGFLNEAGNVRIGNIARFIFSKPTNIMVLTELKKRSDIAAKALREAWHALRDFGFD